MPASRISGAEAWHELSRDERERIGSAAIELVAAWVGTDWAFDAPEEDMARAARPYERAESLLSDRLQQAVTDVIPELDSSTDEPPPIPAAIGPVCRSCGCSQEDACLDPNDGPCSWAEPDLCTSCSSGAPT